MISKQAGPAGYYTNIEGMDPRADWLFGPGQQDYLPHGEDNLIPFIMNLQDEAGVNYVKENFLRDDSTPPMFIPPPYADKMRSSETLGQYFVAIAPKWFFDELGEVGGPHEPLRTALKRIRLGAPLRTPGLSNRNWDPGKAIPASDDPPVEPPEEPWLSDTVVVGVIDDGIAIAHERFRTRDFGSRVQCFWHMDPPDGSPTVDYGREIVKDGAGGIDELLLHSTAADGSIDEDRFYRAAGLIDFAIPEHKAAAWRSAHGTHVLDLAAGEDPADNVLNRPIIAVQLRTATTRDTSGGDLYTDVMFAIDYILERADAMASPGELPVVINFSYGILDGPHDGTSEIEELLNDRILARSGRLRIILPSGNSHLSRCHAQVAFASTNEEVDLNWRVLPDDRTPSLLEIWLPYGGPVAPTTDRIKLSVVAPGGAGAITMLGETAVLPETVENDGHVICAAASAFEAFPTARRRFQVWLQPTTRLQPPATAAEAKQIAPPGVWTVTLHNVSLTPDQPVQLWIQRDDTPYGYPVLGRQSYFDDPSYVRFRKRGLALKPQGHDVEEDSDPEQVASPSHVQRAGSVNGIATGAEVIVAGGYHRKELVLAKYSAGEPITPTRDIALNPDFRKPDAALVSEDSRVHSGVLAAGSRSGSMVSFTGTSVAAPQLARWTADNLSAGVLPDRGAVRDQAQLDEPDPGSLPTQRGGWGRMLRGSAFPRERYWE